MFPKYRRKFYSPNQSLALQCTHTMWSTRISIYMSMSRLIKCLRDNDTAHSHHPPPLYSPPNSHPSQYGGPLLSLQPRIQARPTNELVLGSLNGKFNNYMYNVHGCVCMCDCVLSWCARLHNISKVIICSDKQYTYAFANVEVKKVLAHCCINELYF